MRGSASGSAHLETHGRDVVPETPKRYENHEAVCRRRPDHDDRPRGLPEKSNDEKKTDPQTKVIDEAKPTEAKPTEAKPTEAKPDETKTEAKPTEAKPDEAKKEEPKKDEAKKEEPKSEEKPASK
ncbi:MAG: hypothetical protein QM765_25650 [Myxococcales bacterium]